MLFFTHLISTLIIMKIFSITSHFEVFLCIFFGVLLDVDEIFVAFSQLRKSRDFFEFGRNFLKRGVKRRTWFQDMGGLILSFAISFNLKNFAPFFCCFSHCILDWISYYTSTPLLPLNKVETRGFIKTFSLEEILVATFLLVLFSYI